MASRITVARRRKRGSEGGGGGAFFITGGWGGGRHVVCFDGTIEALPPTLEQRWLRLLSFRASDLFEQQAAYQSMREEVREKEEEIREGEREGGSRHAI